MSLLERKLRRDIGRRRWQFVTILVTVVLGVALFGASYDAYQNLLASYHALFERTHFAALTIEGGDRARVAAAVEPPTAATARNVREPGPGAPASRTTDAVKWPSDAADSS